MILSTVSLFESPALTFLVLFCHFSALSLYNQYIRQLRLHNVCSTNMLNPTLLPQINLVASIWTIIKLISRGTALHSIAEKKSIVTIVLLSISASFMYAPAPIGALLLSNYDLYNPTEVKEGVYDRKVEYEITWFLIISYFPQITSVLNPVILMIRGSQLQEFVRGNLSAKLKNRQNWTQSTFLNKSARVEVTDNHVKENIQMTDVVKTCTIANLQCNVKNFSV